MTTGRINQVTTFRSAFAAIVYSRVTSTRFRDAEFIITFRVQDPSAARTVGTKLGLVERRTRKWHHLISHSRTSQVRSPFPRHGKQKDHPPTMRTTDVRRRTWRNPEWLAASGLTIGEQSTSFNIAQARRTRTA